METEKIYFSETQKFRQIWVWVLLVIIVVIGFYGMFQQLVIGKPFGNNPSSDEMLVVFSIIPVLLFFLFLFWIKLKTEICAEGVSIQFLPVHIKPKKIEWSEIESFQLREYRPLAEYGGWGVRRGLSGKNIAYNISGNTGLQLVLKNGKKILVGTNKPVEMEIVLDQLRKNLRIISK